MKNSQLRIIFAFYLIINTFSLQAQDTLSMSKEEFLNSVKKYHPYLQSLQIQNEIAGKNIMKSRGNFDPNFAYKTGEKTIDNTMYYQQQTAELKIPTWYGIDFNVNYNTIAGNKINEETTKGSIYQIGVEIPLLKNLLYDKRRAMLDQAKITHKWTQAEQILNTNIFLLEAENLYWQWLQSFTILKIQNIAIRQNKERLIFTQKSIAFGERAAIDTTEISAQLQLFILQQQETLLQFQNLTQEIKWYLWQADLQPYIIPNPLIPSDTLRVEPYITAYTELNKWNNESLTPQYQGLKIYRLKNDWLQTELRLKQQELLPKLDLSYQYFNRNFNQFDFLPLFNNNFQYGIRFQLPLFLRQSRADIAIAKLKIKQNENEYQMKQKELQVKVNTLAIEMENYIAQYMLIKQNVSNYEKLLRAEQTRFELGESSLFLINTRETKVLESKTKLIQLQTKIISIHNKIYWLNASF